MQYIATYIEIAMLVIRIQLRRLVVAESKVIKPVTHVTEWCSQASERAILEYTTDVAEVQ